MIYSALSVFLFRGLITSALPSCGVGVCLDFEDVYDVPIDGFSSQASVRGPDVRKLRASAYALYAKSGFLCFVCSFVVVR